MQDNLAYVPAHILTFLQTDMTGKVLHAGSSGIYVQFDQHIFLLSDESWGILPIGIGIQHFTDVNRSLRLQPGYSVHIWYNRMRFPTGSLLLLPAKADFVESGDAAPQISRIRQAALELAALRREWGISMLVQPLVLDYSPEVRTTYSVHAGMALKKLMQALITCNQETIRASLEALLGLGTGLTPSADDVLLGMLYVFRKLPRSSPASTHFFQEQILQMCGERTNKISAAYLTAIINGAPFERMEMVFRGICGEQPLDIQLLTQIGSSSGTEMLLGMLIALRICGYAVNMREELP